MYHFHGPEHSFTALVHVEQTGLKAVIIGVVTDGCLKGHAVEGEYTQITCTHDETTYALLNKWLKGQDDRLHEGISPDFPRVINFRKKQRGPTRGSPRSIFVPRMGGP